ncbi:MAG: response regulator [Acidimicrobiia bacterium]
MTGGAAPRIRVLLAEDHVMVRAGIERLLAATADIEVVGLAANGEEAVTRARALHPDVVVMDLSMPVLDGVEATRRILAELPATRVVVLTSFMDRTRVADAIGAGAAGYLLKDAEPDELARAVRAAARGEMPLDPRVTRPLVERPDVAAATVDLTRREREVLALVAAGLANKLIARRLGISEKTVKAHLTRVFARIGVTDRTQAALWARDHGIAVAP